MIVAKRSTATARNCTEYSYPLFNVKFYVLNILILQYLKKIIKTMSERIKKCEHYLHFLTEETLVKEYILKPLIFMANWQKIYPVK